MKDSNILLKELFRKSIHLCSAFTVIFFRNFYWPTVIALIAIAIFYSVSEILRLKGHPIPVISYVTEFASRKRDENKFVLGPITLVIGIVVVVLLVPLDYAKAGIFALSFGDGLASLAGKTFGKREIPHTGGKTWVGSITCFTAVFISTMIISKNFFISLLIAVVVTLIEVLPLGDWDNILIPVCAGIIYWFLMV